MSEQYAEAGLAVVGVHTPKYDNERKRANVERAVTRYGLQQPIYLDDDGAYLSAFGNPWRPVFILVDRTGRVRHRVQGVLRLDSPQGQAAEAKLRALLEEPTP